MGDSDDILQGFVIAGFTFAGLSCLAWYCRRKKSQMVKSSSTEELSSVGTDDPQI